MKAKYLILLGVFLTSCDLDKFPLDAISPETFFNTENDLRLYTNSFYGMLPGAENIYKEQADNVIHRDLSDEVRGSRIVPTSGGGWSWGDLRNINFYLSNSERCANEGARARYDAVARFFRAYFYHKKVKRFGDVPWYTEVINDKDEEMLQKARSPRAEIMKHVLEDIDYAIEHLPKTKKINEITHWTALALKSRICLYEGTFRKYHPEFNLPEADFYLKESVAASEALMNSGYKIYSTGTPEKDYFNLFSSHDAIREELILARDYDVDLQVYHNLNYYTMTASAGRPGMEKKTVNTYLMRDGSRFTDIPGYESLFFTEEVKDRDPRLSQTIVTPGYTRVGEDEHLVQDFGSAVTGYQMIKFTTERKFDAWNRSANDMPIFRYAEVLLNYAEAKAELGTLTQSDLDKTTGQLRRRVAMPNIDLAQANAIPDPYLENFYPHVSGSNKGVILEIRRERGVELVMEGFRWDDMLRWKEGAKFAETFKGIYFPSLGTFDLDQDGKIDICLYEGKKPSVEGKNIQFLKLNGDVVLENGTSGCIMVNSHINKKWDENKDYLYPIPIQERLLNPNLTQNPGWDDGI